jgi:hypothetical protein
LARMRPVVVSLTLAVLAAACGLGSTASPSATGLPGASGTLPTPVPTGAIVIPDAPPEVTLAPAGSADAEAVTGDLGTFSWNGLVSDAPWVVGRASVNASAGDVLEARLAAQPPVTSWTARWARVVNGVAGDVEGAAEGVDLPILVTAPAAGSWTLQVELRMGTSGSATWYWRVEVAE